MCLCLVQVGALATAMRRCLFAVLVMARILNPRRALVIGLEAASRLPPAVGIRSSAYSRGSSWNRFAGPMKMRSSGAIVAT